MSSSTNTDIFSELDFNVRANSNTRRNANTAPASMKPDRRRLLIKCLGIFQLMFGTLFLSLGAWGLLATKPSVRNTAGAPFWMTVLSFFSGYLALATPRHYHKQWTQILAYTSTFVCIIAMGMASWMLVQLLNLHQKTEITYTTITMALNVFLMLTTGMNAMAAWSAKSTISEARNVQAYPGPPPAYYENRIIHFSNDEFGPPPLEAGAPPPYEP